MNFLKPLNIPLVHVLKILAFLVCITYINIANASLVTVKVEGLDVFDWGSISTEAPGAGSSGPIALNWDPNNDYHYFDNSTLSSI